MTKLLLILRVEQKDLFYGELVLKCKRSILNFQEKHDAKLDKIFTEKEIYE